MSKFFGSWEMNDRCEKSENFLNFCKAVAMKPEEIEYYKKMQETITYSGQGEQWVCEISMGENKSKHEFKLGIKNPPEKGIDGSTFCVRQHSHCLKEHCSKCHDFRDRGQLLTDRITTHAGFPKMQIEPTLESEDRLVEIATTMLLGKDKEIVTRTERILTAPNKMKSIVTDVASGVCMSFDATRK